MEEKSFAMEMLEYSKIQNDELKKQNKRLFIIWVITFIGLLISVVYTIYLHNDIGVEETIDINDVENIENSDIQLGDK